MVLLGYFAGFEKESLRNIMSSIGILAWVFLIVAGIVIYRSIKHEFKHFKDDDPHIEKI